MKNLFKILISTIIVIPILLLDNSSNFSLPSNELYAVYIDNQVVGTTNNISKYYEYLDSELKRLNEVNEEEVYMPQNYYFLQIFSSYEKDNEEEVFNEFKDKVQFLINGVQLDIVSSTNELVVYDQDDIVSNSYQYFMSSKSEAMKSYDNYLNTFISEEERLAIDSNQLDINDDVTELTLSYDVNGSIKIKEQLVPINDVISDEKLYNTLLFGEEIETKKHIVSNGDSFASIADANQMNVSELLVANPNFPSDSTVLVVGQEINVNTVKPLVSITTEKLVTVNEEIVYNTVYEEDPSLDAGEEIVKVAGEVGLNKVVYKIDYVNGQRTNSSEILSQEIVKEPVDAVVVRGSKKEVKTSNGKAASVEGLFAKVTVGGYISSSFGWRNDLGYPEFHTGVDIAGAGEGSPIFAAASGVVTIAGTERLSGNYVAIDHGNGYVTIYRHLSNIDVRVGQNITKGEVIGGMGSTGLATGVHLHFEVKYLGTPIDPMGITNELD